MKLLSHVRLFVTPWTIAYQAPLSMGFSRQQYWSGLPFPSPGDLPHPGIKPWVQKISWRRKRQPTPVFLPGKSHGRRSLVGYSPWGHRESDMTEQLHFHFSLSCYKMDWKRYYCYLCQIVFCLCFSLRVFQYLILYLGL